MPDDWSGGKLLLGHQHPVEMLVWPRAQPCASWGAAAPASHPLANCEVVFKGSITGLTLHGNVVKEAKAVVLQVAAAGMPD